MKHIPLKDENQEESKEVGTLSTVKYVKLGGNSYGLKASEFLSCELISRLTNLEVGLFQNFMTDSVQEANLADIFTGRLKDEIPKSMNFIIGALEKLSCLRELDFSHNACGAPGMKELSTLIKATKTLVVLKITNVGISPVGLNLPVGWRCYSGRSLGRGSY